MRETFIVMFSCEIIESDDDVNDANILYLFDVLNEREVRTVINAFQTICFCFFSTTYLVKPELNSTYDLQLQKLTFSKRKKRKIQSFTLIPEYRQHIV